jgi:N-acetyl-alpha-D-muramate 1-phosphate uridylyltransferase
VTNIDMTDINTAMVLAAGLGSRLRPITNTTPKPLVKVAGRSLLDRGLDQLVLAGVTTAVINISHLGGQIIDHCEAIKTPRMIISDERSGLLDSAGGIVKALRDLGQNPFYILNADTFWIDEKGASLAALNALFDETKMDIALLLVGPENAIGHSGSGDFTVAKDGRLTRATGDARASAPIYAGAGIVHPRIFAGSTATPHSLNLYFDKAISEGRLYGSVMNCPWITVGTPEGLAEAEAAVQALSAARA